ncbi:flagellar hook-length control protein FliK [Oceanospirillum sanctuarii]|uniref:flagellar hook-length control protein FliK n=1 Tax=Oceanospirillum sanctuarii TaxID=1434821 RepID=UPI000A3918D3|nr:flagellar hook-length control protein FliK [Oceanospirillum sanctuarii]
MGVSQSQTVLDLLPASGSVAPKRNQNSSTNQAMFDVALKSASSSVAQASGNDKLAKQDVAANNAEAKGKAVPQNGKEVPEQSQKAELKRPDNVSARDTASVDQDAVNESQRSQQNDVKVNSVAGDEGVKQDANSKGEDPGSESGSVVSVDGEQQAEAVEGDSSVIALTEKDQGQLLKELKSEDLSGEDFLAKLEQVLKAQGISLDDLKALMEENDILSADKFDQLLNDPEALIAQLQQAIKPGSDLSAQLKDLGLQADVAARLSAAMNSRIQQDSAPRFADVLKAEANASQQAGNLVSQLLQEQGAGKDSEAGFDKDRLFEQLLAQKTADPSAKASGFAGIMLKEGVGSNLLGTAGVGAGAAAVGSAEGLHGLAQRSGLNAQAQNLPQLPVLRGLPGQPGATEALNERIMMMRSKGIQTAEIRLDPPDLGSLEVRVRVSGDTTTIQFHSPNPSVREALEAQVNRLREMMEGAGVNLGQVDVSDQSLSENAEEAFASSGGSSGGQGDSEADGAASEQGAIAGGVTQSGLGLVDYFA